MPGRGGCVCSFKSCKRTTRRREKISFFRFPKDPDRAKQWAYACGRDDLLEKDPFHLHKNYRVCGLHFTSKMFLNDLKNRLQPHATPVDSATSDKSIEEIPPFIHEESFETMSSLEELPIIIKTKSEELILEDNPLEFETKFEDPLSAETFETVLPERQDALKTNNSILFEALSKPCKQVIPSVPIQQQTELPDTLIVLTTPLEDVQKLITQPEKASKSTVETQTSKRLTKVKCSNVGTQTVHLLESSKSKEKLNLVETKNTIEKTAHFYPDKAALDEYEKLTDKFLPPNLAKFVKALAKRSFQKRLFCLKRRKSCSSFNKHLSLGDI